MTTIPKALGAVARLCYNRCMRIIDTIATQAANKAKAKKKAGATSGGEFNQLLDASDSPTSTQSTTATGNIAITNLVGLQMEDDLPKRIQQHIAHGEELLDQLNNLRMMLLSGEITPQAVATITEQLHGLVEDHTIPDALRDIIDEIELRAAVEVAKLERGQT